MKQNDETILLAILFAFFVLLVFIIVGSLWPMPEIIGFSGSFIGAIIGGLITLFVMWKTLQENKREHNENLTLSVQPFFIAEVSKNSCKGSYNTYSLFIGEDKGPYIYFLKFINKGRGLAAKFSLIKCEINDKEVEFLEKGRHGIPTETEVIATEEAGEFALKIKVDKSFSDNLNIKIYIEYADILGNEYSQSINFSLLHIGIGSQPELIVGKSDIAKRK